MKPVLESMGSEVIDSDNERYQVKTGYDCLVRVKNPDERQAGKLDCWRSQIPIEQIIKQIAQHIVDLELVCPG